MAVANLNLKEYYDRVLGCWTGKNIGGTLGAPMEGSREFRNIEFYTRDQGGRPAPNDDLDLQLVWLRAVEDNGAYRLNEVLLGEYWMAHIIGPWMEYGVCKVNISNGLYPPLSGWCNNRENGQSNGAWIRSEIWACLFPGSPAEAVRFAWMDACVDHFGDGIYAEMFTVALESAAFVEPDLGKLIDLALAYIPADCRTARAVRLAVAEFTAGRSLKDARDALVADSTDLGWFQAPCNVGFTVLGLLYGGGDFGRTVCSAVNCGDDTDCTGATAGAVFGILHGRRGIPAKWTAPIGSEIRTVAVSTLNLNVPETVEALTRRVLRAARETRSANPALPELSGSPTRIPDELRRIPTAPPPAVAALFGRSSTRLRRELPWGWFEVEYLDGPEVKPGDVCRLRLSCRPRIIDDKSVHFRWRLPEGWRALPGPEGAVLFRRTAGCEIGWSIVPGEFSGAYEYAQLEIRLAGRFAPEFVPVPFQLAGAVANAYPRVDREIELPASERYAARMAADPESL